ncbi:MAG: cupin [Rhodothermaceae bacterium]|nr:MAG: cupin [Rhodothermaceae bacterium]
MNPFPPHRRIPPVRRFRPHAGRFRWEEVPLRTYKPEANSFRGVTRQVLFDAADGLPVQVRYFEIVPGGFSSLERHEHPHAVVILRGRGRVLIGTEIHAVAPFDLVHVPPMTWHQLRAGAEPLGFLCLVAHDRDRPQYPTPDELAALRARPDVAAFLQP